MTRRTIIETTTGRITREAPSTASMEVSNIRSQLPYRVIKASAQTSGKKAINIMKRGKTQFWSTSAGVNHEIILELQEKSLLAVLRIMNKSVSEIELSVGLENKPKKGSFLTIHKDSNMAHYKKIDYDMGCLPCRFVKIRCLRGTPISLYEVQCHGITSRKVPLHFGPRLTRNLEILPSKSLYSDLHGHRQERSPKLRFPLNQSSDASIPFHAVYRPRKTYSDHSFDDEMSVNRHRIHASTARTIDDSNINLNDNTSNHHHHHRNITNNNSAHHSSNSSSHQSKHSISDLHPPYHSHSRSNMHMYHSSNTTNNNNKCALRRHPVMAYTTAVVK